MLASIRRQPRNADARSESGRRLLIQHTSLAAAGVGVVPVIFHRREFLSPETILVMPVPLLLPLPALLLIGTLRWILFLICHSPLAIQG